MRAPFVPASDWLRATNSHAVLHLRSPKFRGNKGKFGANYGPDCFCDQPKLCVGCTCHKIPESIDEYAHSYCP